MNSPSDGEPCPDCRYSGRAAPGSRHVRCDQCRADHQRGKAADAQWDARQRKRDAVNDRRARQGLAPYVDRRVRTRARTPSWDRSGNEVAAVAPLTTWDLRAMQATVDRMAGELVALRKQISDRL